MGRTKGTTLEKPATATCLACGKADGSHSPGCPNLFCPDCGSASGSHHEPCPRSARATPLNGTTGAPVDDIDDGIDHSGYQDERPQRARKKPKVRTAAEAPPLVEAVHVASLQVAIDNREIVAVPQPLSQGKFCEAWRLADGIEVGCTALAVFAHENRNECPNCGKAAPQKDDLYCVAHMALALAGGLQNPQMALGES